MLTGATRAVFSQQQTINSNQVDSATITVGLTTVNKPFHLTSFLPGQTANWSWVDITNSSNIPINLFSYLDGGIFTADPAFILWGNLSMEMRRGIVGDDTSCDAGTLLRAFGPLNDIYGAANRVSIGTNIASSSAMRLCQRVRMDVNAGNNAQGLSDIFNEVIVGEQLTQ